MTEDEWLPCGDPERMLAFLQDRVSDRKLRLFLVACARRVLPADPDSEMVEALAVAERFADGVGTRAGLARARASLKTNHRARAARWFPLYTAHIRSVPAWHANREQIRRAAGQVTRCCAWSSTRALSVDGISVGGSVMMTYPHTELAAQAHLLREVTGNPFRPARMEPGWITSTVRILAETICADRAFDRLPILADALEDAGCDDADILAHCRGSGPHVRGCWALDLVLGKS